nr:MAG TPA: hypothetical protein [Caudoviricetes sp.]
MIVLALNLIFFSPFTPRISIFRFPAFPLVFSPKRSKVTTQSSILQITSSFFSSLNSMIPRIFS